MAEILAVVEILAVMALYLLWTARRLDNLHARVDAAAAALDAQLQRRRIAAIDFAAVAPIAPAAADWLTSTARSTGASEGLGPIREVAENALTHAMVTVATRTGSAAGSAGDRAAATLHDAALRTSFARGFYNDTVHDALVIRDRRLVRWLRLAGHAPHPTFFEMDDEEAPPARISVAVGPTIEE